MTERRRLGDLLVDAGLVSAETLASALQSQKESGLRLGEELVRLGAVTETQVAQLLSNQLALPWVSLERVEFTRELLNLVPAGIAARNCAIPIYVQTIRGNQTLYVAIGDPTSERAIEELSAVAGLPVAPMVAPQTDIRTAIEVYYSGVAPQALRQEGTVERQSVVGDIAAFEFGEVARTPPESDPPGASMASTPPPAEATPTDATDADDATDKAVSADAPANDDAGATVTDADADADAEGVKMVTLTLLDGTKVRLPAPGGQAPGDQPAGAEAGLTAGDLVAALVARSQGADVDDVLGDTDWELLFAALLSLLIRKGLIADWEFVKEWKKRKGAAG